MVHLSGLSKYFATNEAPSQQDAAIIQDAIHEKAGKIAAIKDEISLLHERIRQLTQNKDGLIQDLNAHRALLSGVRKLPLEILGEVFALCTQGDCAAMTTPHSLKAPMLFCQVSRYWRSAAISNPSLWTTFGIDVYQKPNAFELTKLWISRTQQLPLTFGLIITASPDAREKPEHPSLPGIRDSIIHLMREIVVPNFRRCRSFTLRCQAVFDDDLIDAIPEPDFVPYALEHLDIPLDLPMCPFMFRWCLGLAMSSPCIKHLICGLPLVLHKREAFTNWSFIETFDLQQMGVSPTEAVKFFSVAPRLTTCVMGLCNWSTTTAIDDLNAGDGIPKGILKHESLRILKVYDRADLLGNLLDLISLPKLASLTVSGLVQNAGWPDAQLRNFLERSDCALQVLNVQDNNLTAENLISYLSMDRIRKSLKDLRLHKTVPIPKQLLEFLTVGDTPGLPNLRTIMCTIDPINQASMFELFVKSRRKINLEAGMTSGLKRVYLTIISPIYGGLVLETPDLSALLNEVQKTGEMDVKVTLYRFSEVLTTTALPNPPSPPDELDED